MTKRILLIFALLVTVLVTSGNRVVHRGSTPPGVFDPADYGTVVRYLNADDISGSDGDPVSTWTAAVGLAPTQATGGNQPTLQTAEVNGHNVVRFDGTDDYLSVVDGTIAIQSWVIVVKVLSFDSSPWLGYVSTSSKSVGRVYPDAVTLYDGDGTNDIVGYNFNGLGYVNGSHQPTLTAGFNVVVIIKTTQHTDTGVVFKIAGNVAALGNSNIDVAMVIEYSNDVSANLTALENALGTHFGITITH